MRRFVGSINIPDCALAMDIIQALEANKRTKYDIEMYEGSGAKYDPMERNGREDCRYITLKVFVVEESQDEQMTIGFN